MLAEQLQTISSEPDSDCVYINAQFLAIFPEKEKKTHQTWTHQGGRH